MKQKWMMSMVGNKKSSHMMTGSKVLLMAVALLAFAGLPSTVLGSTLLHNSTNLGTTYGTWGVTGGKYGAFTCATCHAKATGNIKRVKKDIVAPNSPIDQFPIETGGTQVTFLDVREGLSDFGDDSVAGRADDTKSDKICEACHTQTKHHNYNVNDNTVAGRDHYNKADCMVCHPHNQGFKPLDCTACHGDPPSNAGELANNPFTTGSTTAGAHVAHATTLSYACENCHDGYVMPQEGAVAGKGDISIGFNNFGSTTGDYAGQIGVSYNGALSGDDSLSCSTVYCHGSTLTGGTDTTPQWDVPTTGDCGKCHGVDSTSPGTLGSHPKHAGNGAGQLALACTKCHPTVTDGTHVTGTVNWELETTDAAFGTSATYGGAATGNTAGLAPSSTYASCSSVYCHDPSSAGVSSPVWGGTTNCLSCHGNNAASATPMSTGKHTAHLNNLDAELGSFDCGYCHDTTVDVGDDGAIANAASHVDTNVDIAYNAALPGTDGGCTNLYCHSDGKGGYNNQTIAADWQGAGTLDCKGCHGDNGSSAVGEPDYVSVGVGQTTSNSHAKHVAVATDCNYCHTSTSSTGTDITGSLHIDKNIDVTISSSMDLQGDFDPTNNYNPAVGFKTCSNVYCHDPSDLGFVSPSWGGTTDCESCHGNNRFATSKMNTGKHTAHINNSDAELGSFDCGYCHDDTVDVGDDGTVTNAAKHADQSADVAYNAALPGTDGTCNNLYCHSDGKGGYNNQAIVAAWNGAATLDCKGCHGDNGLSNVGEPDYASVGIGQTTSNSHAKHVSAASDCNDCHTSTSSTGTDITGALHINANIDVTIAAGYDDDADPTNNYNANVGVKTCSNIYCHDPSSTGQVSPSWGDTTDCLSCHGSNAASISPMNTGKHGAHINNADPELASFDCGYCHDATVDVGDDGTITNAAKHADQTKDVAYNTALPGGDATCNNLYCHSDGKGGYNDQVLATAWAGAATLDCKGCHGDNGKSTAGEPDYNSAGIGQTTSNSHAKHVSVATDCNDCHTSTTSTGTDITGALHLDQNIDVTIDAGFDSDADPTNNYNASVGVKTCSNVYCHDPSSTGQVSPSWGDTTDCTSCHGNNAASASPMATDGHGAHMNAGGSALMTDKECATCHIDTVSSGDDGAITGSAHVNMVNNVAIIGNFDSDTTPGNNWDGTNCSNIYCHSDGKAAPTYAIAKDWTTAISDCTSCHGGAGGSNGGNGAATALSASHTIHTGTNGTTQFAFTCDVCHVATASSNSAVATAANHVNKLRDVAVSSAEGGDDAIGTNYNSTTQSCATTNCHGSGDVNVKWLAAEPAGQTTGDCSLCHGMAADATVGRDTAGDTGNTDAEVGAHVAHLTSAKNWTSDIACSECHNTTVTNQAAGTYMDKVTATGHIDTGGAAEITFGTVANYNSASPSYSGAPGGTCATTYCHDGAVMGKGLSGTLNVPDWNTPYFTGVTANDCSFCHGYPPNPANGHPNDTNCSTCHTNTVGTDDGFIDVTKHINGIVEAEGGDSCLDCHGSGAYKDPNVTNPDHADHTNVAAFLSGKSLSAPSDFGNASTGWYNVTYNASGAPVIGCGQCHPADEATFHRNDNVDTKLTPTGEATIPGVNAKNHNTGTALFTALNECSGVYCHSDGEPDGTYPNSPVWGSDTINDCKSCHLNGPTTGTHSNHAVGIHYQTLYNGSTGLMAESGTNNSGAAHGDENASDPISCNTCHFNTVEVEYNSRATTCNTAACHNNSNADANVGNGWATIKANSSSHLDGEKTVFFADLSTFKSRAQVRTFSATEAELDGNWTRNNGYKANNSFDQAKVATPTFNTGTNTCSSVSCHNGNETTDWSLGFQMKCDSCHTRLP